MNPCEWEEARLHSFLTSTWKNVFTFTLRLFSPLKWISRAHRIGDLLGTRAGLDDLRNRISCFCGGNLDTIWETEYLAPVAGILIRFEKQNILLLWRESYYDFPIVHPATFSL
jgi:hypothetical protein